MFLFFCICNFAGFNSRTISVCVCFYFHCVCVLWASGACVNKCADGIRVDGAGKAAVGVAATLCLSSHTRCKGSVT